MNLQMEINSLKQRIAELERQAKHGQEFPQDRDDYWYVNDDADVMDIEWDGSDYDQDRLSIDNVFRTKEGAEFAAEKLKVEAELRKYSKPFDYERFNHFIKIHQDGTIEIHFDKSFQNQGTIYFESGEKAAEAIKSVGIERIKKYIFGVED